MICGYFGQRCRVHVIANTRTAGLFLPENQAEDQGENQAENYAGVFHRSGHAYLEKGACFQACPGMLESWSPTVEVEVLDPSEGAWWWWWWWSFQRMSLTPAW